MEDVAEVGEVDERAGGGGVGVTRLSRSNLGPRTVSGIRNEVVAVRWGAIRVSVTGCAFWRIVSWIPRYEGTLIGAVVLLAVWVAAFVWIGDSWWQLASATVLAVAMTHRLSRPRRRTSADIQIRPLERLGWLDHREPAGGNQLWLVAK